MSLIELWDETFSVYSFNNPEYSRACLHLTIGTLLKDCRIRREGTKTDPRISVLYLKPTFSGGSAGFDMVAKIFRDLELKPQKITDATDAALIGSIEKGGDGNPVQIKGILDKSLSDLVYWGEASILFNKKLPPHQQKTMNYIQMGLNPIDSEESKLRKPMRDGTVECDVEASLLMVTYPPKELDDQILSSGFIQRSLFIPKTLDLEGRLNNIKEDIKRYCSGIDVKSKMESIVNRLKEVRDQYPTGTEFTIDPEAIGYFEKKEEDILKPFRKSNERVQTYMGAIIASTVRKSTAIAMHHCAITRPGETTITEADLEYALKDVLKPQMDMIHEYLGVTEK
jgi:hypothetical protein